jgi:hypothetical protein
LNPGESVVLVAECGGRRILLGLHPEPGNYQAYLPPGTDVEPGSMWTFYCPVCQRSLVTKLSDRFCCLDGPYEGPKHRVYFSRVAGEQATFVVTAEQIHERHGRDVERHSLDLLSEI